MIIEYSGEMLLVDKDEQSDNIPLKYMEWLADKYECFAVIENVEKIVRVENDGVFKGKVTNTSLYGGTWENGEWTGNYVSVQPYDDEYEGSGVYFGYLDTEVEEVGDVFLNDVIVYYNVDTLEVIKVEGLLEE